MKLIPCNDCHSVCFPAQVYGYQSIKTGQSSENLVGRFVNSSHSTSQPLTVGTKFFTVPWTNVLVGGGFRLGRQSMIDALRASLKRMDRDKIDLYQVGIASQLVAYTCHCLLNVNRTLYLMLNAWCAIRRMPSRLRNVVCDVVCSPVANLSCCPDPFSFPLLQANNIG